MRWREESLDSAGIAAAERLAEAAGPRFYLAGGTGLALRLGHRVSLDLDLFSAEEPLGEGGRLALIERLRGSGAATVLESREGTLHLRLGATHASLFRYPYPLLGKTDSWRGLRVASERDIAAMKLSAAVGRGTRKDFVDLYLLARRLGGIEPLLAAGRERFPDHEDFPLHACRALVYFADAEKEPMPRLLRPVDWRELTRYFEREVPKAVRRRLR